MQSGLLLRSRPPAPLGAGTRPRRATAPRALRPTAPRPPPRRASVAVRADLGSAADQMVTTGAVVVSVAATLLAIFADPVPPQRLKENQENGFRWGVMGAISFFPLFNWLAWISAALDDEERSRTYYWFAALYALPLLHSGLTVDGFTLTMLLTGAAHVQAERIAATEPDLQASIARALRPLSVLRTLARAARGLLSALLPAPRAAPERAPAAGGRGGGAITDGGRGRAWEGFVGGGAEPSAPPAKTRDEEIEEFLRDEELRDFDRRMRERDGSRRGGGGGGSRRGASGSGGAGGWGA